jgi:hypothetical protein
MLGDQLRLMFDWYKGMVEESTGRLLYLYDPENDVTIGDGEPIRDIAAIWDVEVLSAFLRRGDLRPLIRQSLDHFSRLIVEREEYAIVAPREEQSSRKPLIKIKVGGRAVRLRFAAAVRGGSHVMQVQAETYLDERGAEKLRRFRFDDRVVEVADNIDQWHGAGHRYVKVKGSDGDLYILRHDETRANWELTMYQRSESQDLRASTKGTTRSPRIAAVDWGRIDVEGFATFRDAKLFPGGAREWDWNETGTAHEPGIQPADIAELLDHGATTIVLSQGMLSRLHVCPETLRLLADKGIRTHVLPTAEAVKLYNQLREAERVAGLFHTTC